MPVLSICIPTYNRAEILRKSLESLVMQDVFLTTEDVEIVISDNCSTDHTKEVVDTFIQKYGMKIKYFCNEQNVLDKNFSLALERGTGDFLRLCNDTLIFYPEALTNMVQIVKDARAQKPILFFLNAKKKENLDVYSLDGFVKNVSFMSTWIGGFGIWKDDKAYLSCMSTFSETKLPQTATLLKMMGDKKHAKIIFSPFCKLIKPSLSGGYNLSEVFIKNYLSFYDEYISSGVLQTKIYENEKWLVLKKHVLPRQFNIKYCFQYDKSLFWYYTKPYHRYLRFYFLLGMCFFKKAKYCLKNVLKLKGRKQTCSVF